MPEQLQVFFLGMVYSFFRLQNASVLIPARFCIAPLDVVKIRLQLQDVHIPPVTSTTASRSTNTFSTFTSIIRNEGITALWKGNLPAEGLYLSYGAVQFLAYRMTTQLLQPSLSKSEKASVTTTFISGSVAGTLATTITYPLDLLRTRLATSTHRSTVLSRNRIVSPSHPTLSSTIKRIYSVEGPYGFFRGLSAGLAQIVPYMGLFFTFYETLKARLSLVHTLPLQGFGSAHAIAGVTASVGSKTLVFPLDTIRKRMQVMRSEQKRQKNMNIMEITRDIVRKQGWRALYRGLGVGLVKAAPTGAITVWTYERVMWFFARYDHK